MVLEITIKIVKRKEEKKDLLIIRFIEQIRLQENIQIGRKEFSHSGLIGK